MLTESELIHYSRHIILPQIDESGQQKLKASSALIVGMGGLGAPVALYLAAAGVGKLVIADHDKVEASNLQRQVIHKLSSVGKSKVESAKDSMQSLNPWLQIVAIERKLEGLELEQKVAEVDLVVDCSDNFVTRFAINHACIKAAKPLVSGAAIRFEGQLAVFNLNQDSACYQCLYQPDIQLDENCFEQGVLSPLVGTIGTLQATEVLKILAQIGTPADGKLLIYDALHSDFRSIKIPKDKNCKACGDK